MTLNAEEETNLPEMAEMLWLDGSFGRALEYQSKGCGFKSHSEEINNFHAQSLGEGVEAKNEIV